MLNTFLVSVVYLILAGLIVWGVRAIVAVLPIDAVFKRVIEVLCIVVVVICVVVYVLLPLLRHLPGIG